ncbi:hypothetical protein O988_09669 [Pseudogymnoascus sp. VKM F-3808]|nr:hypothetical protein O988_09669 [Pseudogymnoascus sp. VKM F-3808]
MLRYALGKLALTNDRRGQDRICGSDTGGHDQTLQPVQRRNHPPNEQTRNEPSKCHNRYEEEGDGPPMLLHIVFWQFDADGETLDHKDDSREFEGYLIDISPGAGVNEVGGMRAKDDAANGGDSRLADVQSFLDKGRT